MKSSINILSLISGADPGFVVREGVSRRRAWGPLKVPQRVQGRAPEALGFKELQTFI
jgi:hypothetical protein